MSGAMGDMGSLLKQAQLMQRELDRVKGELAEKRIEGTAGGQEVLIALSASKQVLEVRISASAMADSTPVELAEMIKIALSSALEEAEQVSRDELSKVTGGLDLPGLM